MLKRGDKLGIVCCSNGQKAYYVEKLKILEDTLIEMGYVPVFSEYIYEKENIFCGTAKERADALMDFYRDEEIRGIFDISGGDVANGVLPYLDYEFIAKSDKLYWGYSDLTTVINAIYAKTGKASALYQLRNLIYDHKEVQIANFSSGELFEFDYKFLQQHKMEGTVIGGNIRCFLKLAGTEFMPDFQDKILLLESLGGDVAKMETYLCQLKQLGAFDKVAGILLGTFTEMEKENYEPTVETLVKRMARADLPIAKTQEIGHGADSKAIMIGQELCIEE